MASRTANSTTHVPGNVVAPDRVATRLGDLEFFDSFDQTWRPGEFELT